MGGGAVESDTIHLNQTSTARLKAAFKQIYAKAATGGPCARPHLVSLNQKPPPGCHQCGMERCSVRVVSTHALSCQCNARLSSLSMLA